MQWLISSLLIHSILLNVMLFGIDAPIVYDQKLSTLNVNGTKKVTLKSGADIAFVTMSDSSNMIIDGKVSISHMHVKDNAKVEVNAITEISHLTLQGNSKAIVNAGNLSSLNLTDSSEVDINKVKINGGMYYTPNVKISGGVITFTENSKINLFASHVELKKGRISGFWGDGTKFSIWLVKVLQSSIKNNGSNSENDFISTLLESMPSQINVYAPVGPSFDCKKAASFVEKEVCAKSELAELDLTLSQLYNHALEKSKGSNVVKNSQRVWLAKNRNQCKNYTCLKEEYKKRILRLEDDFGSIEPKKTKPNIVTKNNTSFTNTPFEPKLIYSINEEVCSQILSRYRQEYFEGSSIVKKTNNNFTRHPWKTMQEGDYESRLHDLGKITIGKNATLLRWQEPFNWRGDTFSAFFYKSNLSHIDFKDLNTTALNALKAKGKMIYPSFKLNDFNNSKYNIYASEWRDIDIFSYKENYYFENKLNDHWSVNQKNIATLQILDDGEIKPICIIQKKYVGENPLLKKQNFALFLDALRNMTGGYGDCGTLASGHTILSLRIPTTLEKISFNPWKEHLQHHRVKQINTIPSFIQEWGYQGLWNYDVYTRYLNYKDKAKEDLINYYIETYNVDKPTATSYMKTAYDEILSAHFNVPYYGLSPKPYDLLCKALLEGRSLEEIKPMLVDNWINLGKENDYDNTEPALFFALKHPKIVQYLLDQGSDVNATNSFGKTALMYAAQYNLYDTAKVLLKAGIEVNKHTTGANDRCSYTLSTKNTTALHYAIRYADAKFVKLLLENGANKELKDSNKKTAFDWIELFKEENKNLTSDEINELTKLLKPISEEEYKKIARKNVILAQKYYAKKGYKSAVVYYEKALEYEANNPMAISDLALTYYKLKDYNNAAKTAEKNMYSSIASNEQKASAYYNMGMICTAANPNPIIMFEGKSYCHDTPFEYYLKADMKKSSQARAKKIIEMLYENETLKLNEKYTLLQSKDKKIKIISTYPYEYVFSTKELGEDVTLHAINKEFSIRPSDKEKHEKVFLKKFHVINYLKITYYIYRSHNGSISLGSHARDMKICYDKMCHNNSELEVLYE